MPRRLKLRQLTPDEAEQIRDIAHSRTMPAALVQRAKLIEAMMDDPNLPAGKAGRLVGYKSDLPGRTWLKRFNELGVDGLHDQPRPGRPPTHSQMVRSQLLHLALQKPRSLGLPFELWTVARLRTHFEETEGIHLAESTVWRWVEEEGLHWKRQ